MTALVNSMEDPPPQCHKIITDHSALSSENLEIPIDLKSHNALPLSPRQKQFILSTRVRSPSSSQDQYSQSNKRAIRRNGIKSALHRKTCVIS